MSPRERNFAMIFQNYALFPHLTVRDNITFGMKIRKEDKASWQPRLETGGAMLQLGELLDRKPAKLSGGQRQRVAMARAIVRNPRLFLMDEPLSNLDARLRTEVRDSIMALHHQLKTTTIYVTHDQTEAMSMADRIVVMNGGVVQQVGKPEHLYARPANLFVAGFIGSPAMNLVSLPCEDGRILPATLNLPLPSRRARKRTSGLVSVRSILPTGQRKGHLTLSATVLQRETDGRRLPAPCQHTPGDVTLHPPPSRGGTRKRRYAYPRFFLIGYSPFPHRPSPQLTPGD
ncbi:sn-glycerol-3-phosphate import ATP-binding protein UgpC [Cedecea neteri]|uniref:sn-glycerol-3-phosphate import ATP-binding protein UgpC n=1 Tax=Cedecea neteri TaxID=158822 RepID=A0A2X3JCK5_9ENTR|nr:sn-glycerol-3-phosphate import ATP-binding protein UgpC [Cedecea neteri]